MIATGLGVTFLVAWIVMLWMMSGSKTQAQLEQVQIGMTREEVVAIFGGEPNARYGDPTILSWAKKTDQAIVWFDDNGRVRAKKWYDASMDSWWTRLWRIVFLPV